MRFRQYFHMLKKVLIALLYILIFPALFLILSGDLIWPAGLLFCLWFLILCWGTILYLYKKDPALLEERFKKPGTGNAAAPDRFIVYGLAIGFFFWIVVMPLDARRFGWSPVFPPWLNIFGFIFLAGAFFLFFRSYTDNTFLSPLVRIQEERHQTVVSTGVYGFVRHPMYLGAVLMFTGAPLLLGSVLGLIAGLFLCLLLIIRIPIEETLLSQNLDGYIEYRKRVRYRLIPFLW